MKSPRVFEGLIRHKIAVLIVLGLITAVGFFFCLRTTFDASIEIWFLEGDQGLTTYRQFLDRFDADEVTVFGIFTDDVFAPDVLADLDRITREIEKAPHAHRVQSLTNIDTIRGVEGGIEIGPLVESLPVSASQAEAIRRDALANVMIRGGLVSADSKATAVVIELDPKAADFTGKLELTDALEAIRKTYQRPGLKIYLAGTSVLDAAFYSYSNRDFSIFGPVTFLLVMFASFLVFRRISAAMILLAVVVITSIWIFGLMAALGIKVNVLSSALGGLILAIGIADTIHILADYYQELMKGKEPDQAASDSIRQLFIPCLFTSATTAAGMLSLTVSVLKPIRQFGWLAALAVTFAFLLSFTLVPAVLRLAKPPDSAFIARQKDGLLSRLLAWLGRPTRKSAAMILIVTAPLMALSAWGLTTLEVGSNPMNYFKKGDPVRVETQLIDDALGGSATIEMLVHAPNEGLKNPEILTRLDELQRWMNRQPGVTQTLSVVDSLKEMNRVLNDGDPAAYVVPDSRAKAAQYYLLLEGEEDFGSYVQENYTTARITTRIRMSDSQQLVHDMPRVDARLIQESERGGMQIEMTGLLALMARMEVYLLDSQFRSFLLAFCVITLMMILLLRSPRLGLLSMIPNLMPILCGMAFMGLMGITLDVGTVMIGSIAMGLVVDDSVHFLARLRRFRRAGRTLEDAVEGTITEVGRPIIVTSVVLAAGFSVLMLGSFAPNIYFGMVTALVILLALLFDLVVLPAVLIALRPKV